MREISRRLRPDIRRHVSDNRERMLLWAPVCLGLGIAVYFMLSFEAAAPAVITIMLIAWSGAWLAWRRDMLFWRYPALAVALLASGLLLALLRSQLVAAPVIPVQWRAGQVEATVQSVEKRKTDRRVVLSALELEGLDKAETPNLVRIVLRQDIELAPGNRIRLKARLSPPATPSIPGVYDFARRAWFSQLGATGFALGPVRILNRPDRRIGFFSRVQLSIERFRHELSETIRDHMKSIEGKAIGVALITGDRSGITEPIRNTMRDAGLAHLLAISGLHMGLLVILLFAGIRAVFAGIEPLPLHFPIKKWAACAALAGSFSYLLIAGAPLPTQRAFLMTTIVLLAVMIDRHAISMRMVAFAALVILMLQPEALLGASFQLSFAAVTALVAVYETDLARRLQTSFRSNPIMRIAGYFLTLVATTIVATLATSPLAQYHFGTFALYGLLGNLVGVPLMGFVIMPGALLALVLMPIGLAGAGFWIMEQGIRWTFEAASWVSALPGAQVASAPMDLVSILLIVFGGLWLCLWKGGIRFHGLWLVLIGIIFIPLVRAPDILVSGNGRLVAVTGEQGRLYVSHSRREKYTAGQWMRRVGVTEAYGFAEREEGAPLSCDSLGCALTRDGWNIAIVTHPAAQAEDCLQAGVMIAPEIYIRDKACPGPAKIIDRGNLQDNGGYILFLEGQYPWETGLKVLSVQETSGERPWTARTE